MLDALALTMSTADYIDATMSDLKASDAADFKRLHVRRGSALGCSKAVIISTTYNHIFDPWQSKFTIDVLQQRDIARRTRPTILTAQRRKKDTAARLERIARASVKDGSN